MKKLTKYQKAGIGTAAALFVTLIVAVIAIFAGKGTESYRSIKIVETNGQVTIGRNGIGELDAAVNMNLISGDHVHTGQGAYVVLMLDADKYVMLGETGSMQVVAEGDKTRGRTSIRLEQGSVLSEIQNPLERGESYEVVTPNATMSVRGTVFEIDRDENGEVSLLVFDGTVALELDGQEPVPYNAGEYMQFKEGNPPQIIVDRKPISEEVMNEQMRQRLKEINESGKKLEMGTVQLAENNAPSDEAVTSPEPEMTSGPVTTQEPVTTPEPETTPEPTEAPAPTPTPKPAPKPTPTPTPEPTPEVTPEPAQQPVWTWQPTPTPGPTSTPTPKPTPKPTPGLTPTPTPGPTPTPTPVPGLYYQVVFANPTVWTSDIAEDTSLSKMGDPYSTAGYVYVSVATGEKVEKPSVFTPNGSGVEGLKVAGWWYCENDNEWKEWNLEEDVVKGQITLYPVWEDEEENKYWPVFFKGALYGVSGAEASMCVCLPEDTKNMPMKGLNNGSNSIYGWAKTSGEAWNPDDNSDDSVKGVTVLWTMEQPATPTPTPTPTPSAEPTPTPTPTPSAEPTPTPTPTPSAEPTPTPTPTPTYTVTFVNAYIWPSGYLGTLEGVSNTYESKSPEADGKVKEPEITPIVGDPNSSVKPEEFELVGWYDENNEKWDFEAQVEEDITLYPEWKWSGATQYYPVIFRGALSGNAGDESICVCFVGGVSISMPKSGLKGNEISGWQKTVGGDWTEEAVTGVTVLQAND